MAIEKQRQWDTEKSIAIYDAISSGKNWMGKWHLIQKQRTELHRKEKSLKHILVRTTPKNLKSLLDGRSPGGPSILFNSSFTSRDLHLARSSSTLWCNKIFANWLLVGPFFWDFLSSHRLKMAFEAKSLSFAQWLLAFYMKERGMPSTVPDTKKFLKEVARNH